MNEIKFVWFSDHWPEIQLKEFDWLLVFHIHLFPRHLNYFHKFGMPTEKTIQKERNKKEDLSRISHSALIIVDVYFIRF